MCRVDHAGAANARPRRGLRPFRPCARFARSSDSAVGSLKCSPVSKRSSKSPVRAAAAASMGASVRPSAFGCGCCSDAARGGCATSAYCASAGARESRSWCPSGPGPACPRRAGLFAELASRTERRQPASGPSPPARPKPCNAGLFLYWLAAWHRMSGPLPMCSRRRMCGAGAARAAYCRSGSSRRRLKSPHACD